MMLLSDKGFGVRPDRVRATARAVRSGRPALFAYKRRRGKVLGRTKGCTMLREDINAALKEAMKAHDAPKVSTLRLINAALKNADIEARGQGKPALADEDVLSILQKMIKQRQESVELYEKGARPELAAQEREEIAVISAYLPKQLSAAETEATVKAVIAEIGAAGMKDMGKVIAVLRERHSGQLDMGKASGIVKGLLK
jgi:uncharacterized protein